MNHKRVERIWKAEGLKVPRKQPKRGRLWFNDGSCIRLRPAHKDHVWAYDFVQASTHDGRSFRMLTLVDEYTREFLAIDVARKLRSDDVLDVTALETVLVHPASATPDEFDAADINDDGRVDGIDIQGLVCLLLTS